MSLKILKDGEEWILERTILPFHVAYTKDGKRVWAGFFKGYYLIRQISDSLIKTTSLEYGEHIPRTFTTKVISCVDAQLWLAGAYVDEIPPKF